MQVFALIDSILHGKGIRVCDLKCFAIDADLAEKSGFSVVF